MMCYTGPFTLEYVHDDAGAEAFFKLSHHRGGPFLQDGQVEYSLNMYTADVLRNVVALRSEIASLRDMNDRYAAQEDPAPVASRANAGRRTRLQEIVRELAAIAKDQRP